MDKRDIIERVLIVIPLLLSLTVHEWAHAKSAYMLGDDTAEREGRLTLNPIVHIDPVGTLLLPLMGIPFGWAKPVPVNPQRFNRTVNMRAGMMLTAAAGPISNVILAMLCAVLLGLAYRFGGESVRIGTPVAMLLAMGIQVNVALAIFNLLPIPPLDGSRVADGLMPRRYERLWEQFVQIAPFVLLGVILLPRVIGFSPIGVPTGILSKLFMKIAYAIAGY